MMGVTSSGLFSAQSAHQPVEIQDAVGLACGNPVDYRHAIP